MTTLEVTVLDDSKASFILSLLQEFRYISIGNVTKAKETEGALDFEKFDTETQNRIKAYFNDKKTGYIQPVLSLDNWKGRPLIFKIKKNAISLWK